MNYVYSEFSFYSPILDSRAVRLSVSDGKTGEFFAIVPEAPLGKSRRLQRERALMAIEAAIDAGLPPGQVTVNLE